MPSIDDLFHRNMVRQTGRTMFCTGHCTRDLDVWTSELSQPASNRFQNRLLPGELSRDRQVNGARNQQTQIIPDTSWIRNTAGVIVRRSNHNSLRKLVQWLFVERRCALSGLSLCPETPRNPMVSQSLPAITCSKTATPVILDVPPQAT